MGGFAKQERGDSPLPDFGGNTCALPLDQDINQELVEVIRLRRDVRAQVILIIAPAGRDIFGQEIEEGVVGDTLPDLPFIIEDDLLDDEPGQTFGPLLWTRYLRHGLLLLSSPERNSLNGR
jgi:hypothetical protein